jgi:hypothetical protein
MECSWTQRSLENGITSVLVVGFGSSDCWACPAHLVHAPSWKKVQEVRQRLELDCPHGGFYVSNGFSGSLVQLPENSAS